MHALKKSDDIVQCDHDKMLTLNSGLLLSGDPMLVAPPCSFGWRPDYASQWLNLNYFTIIAMSDANVQQRRDRLSGLLESAVTEVHHTSGKVVKFDLNVADTERQKLDREIARNQGSGVRRLRIRTSKGLD